MLLVAVTIVPATLLTMIGATWLAGNVLGITGPGSVLFGQADLVANALTLLPAQNADQVAQLSAGIPPFWGLVGLALGGALLAGFTINGLFAFGEEYGWRGWLADELRPLGAFWANVITGVLWGLWHAPLILLGFNYGDVRAHRNGLHGCPVHPLLLPAVAGPRGDRVPAGTRRPARRLQRLRRRLPRAAR